MRRGLKWLSGHVPKDDQWGLGVAIAAAVGGAPLPPMDFRFVKPGGEEIWLRASNTAVTDGPEGRRLQGLVFDITETMHAQAERALMETELRRAWRRSSRPSASSPGSPTRSTRRCSSWATPHSSCARPSETSWSCSRRRPPSTAPRRLARPAELLERVQAAEDHADLAYLRERVPAAFDGAGMGASRRWSPSASSPTPPTSRQQRVRPRRRRSATR